MQRKPRVLALSGTVLLTALLAGCGGGGNGTSSGGTTDGAARSSSAEGGTPKDAAAPATGADAFAATKGGVSGTQVRASVLDDSRSLIRKAAITVQVKDVPAAARRASQVAIDAGGMVQSEQTNDDPGDRARSLSTMTLQVPPKSYAVVLTQLAALGTRVEQNQSTDDVTTQVVDVQARISAQRASVARVQALLARAKSLGEVVSVESELTRRQADLESLESQRKALAAQTELATIVATFQATPTTTAALDKSHLGFLSGLDNGWTAFVAVVLVALTVIGAALPFLVTALLIGLVAWRVYVSARRRGLATTPAQPLDPAQPA